MPNTHSVAAPGYGQLAANLTALESLIDAEVDKNESLRHLSDSAYGAMHGAGLWHMLTPRALGGSELSFCDAMTLAERVA